MAIYFFVFKNKDLTMMMITASGVFSREILVGGKEIYPLLVHSKATILQFDMYMYT